MLLTDNTRAQWQQELAECVTALDELLVLLQLKTSGIKAHCDPNPSFRLQVPRSFIARMRVGDPNDPLLRQVLPLQEEHSTVTAYNNDPLAERDANPIPGLLHKYHGRVLLTMASRCAINCRYCFRRHFPYQVNQIGQTQWLQIVNYIEAHTEVEEVILSGGEPLLHKDETLSKFINALAQIPHLKWLRIHTRLPVVIPSRVTASLVDLLDKTRLQVVMVMHCNHPQELDNTVQQAWQRLKSSNIHLFNQTVLLKGVNDEEQTLIALQKSLFAAGVMPYYLHQLDKVQGAAHFAVDNKRAKALQQYLREHLPGYLVPRFVVEQAGQRSKMPL